MIEPGGNRVCLLTLCFVLAVGLGVLPVHTALAQSTTTVHIVPNAVEVPAGGTVDLAVEVVDADGIYGFDVSFTFDPSVVEVVDADPGQGGVQMALGLLLDPGFVLVNRADNEAGTARMAMTQLNPSEAKIGTGNLIVVTLRAVGASGSATTVSLTDAQLAWRDGTIVDVSLFPGQVDVVPPDSANPTNTPVPTQGAGTPMPTATPVEEGAPTATATPDPALPPSATPQPTASPTSPALPSPTAQSSPVPEPSAAQPTLPPPSGSSATPGAAATSTVAATMTPTDAMPAATETIVPTIAPPEPSAVIASSATPIISSVTTPTSEPTVVAAVLPEASSLSRTGEPHTTSGVSRVFLWVAVGALVLAGMLGLAVVAIVVSRRGQPPNQGGES